MTVGLEVVSSLHIPYYSPEKDVVFSHQIHNGVDVVEICLYHKGTHSYETLVTLKNSTAKDVIKFIKDVTMLSDL